MKAPVERVQLRQEEPSCLWLSQQLLAAKKRKHRRPLASERGSVDESPNGPRIRTRQCRDRIPAPAVKHQTKASDECCTIPGCGASPCTRVLKRPYRQARRRREFPDVGNVMSGLRRGSGQEPCQALRRDGEFEAVRACLRRSLCLPE